MSLSPRQARFVEEYLIDLNAKQAAVRAGYSEKTAQEQSSRLLSNVKVAAAVAAAQKKLSERTNITQEMVLQRWWQLANVDMNELVEYRRECCRHCWGKGFKYQWTEQEYAKESRLAKNSKRPAPDCSGGFGYLSNRAPNPACPECAGEGLGKIHVKDSRELSGPARMAFAGVKIGKDGLQVLAADREKALENVARHLGMFNDRLDITSGGDKINSGVLVVPGTMSEAEWEKQQQQG
ncbi:terminase small subunit [Pusillimonas minor]|uniref:Terminase small subunit n=1 Tax=Pusillimonas minor TaxID=2697024 RepID=A0A842HMS7_9BURK|nr:terminase small subunit [Pusillimonas minor]MBC2768571.1 terminase small subunit [Pusillimonas minor]